MPYDEGLAQRVRELLEDRSAVEEKIMFGGLCFMVSGHMCCGIVKETLMARVGPDNYEQCLAKKHAREMDLTGRAMKGLVYVAPEGIKSDAELSEWVSICIGFAESLPAKRPK